MKSNLISTMVCVCIFGISAGNVNGAEWSEIQARGYLIVGVKDNYPPLAYRNEAGKFVGFEIDIAQEIAHKLLGDVNKIKFIPLKNPDRFEALWNDRVDILIGQITVTGNRQRLVDFSPSYYTDGTYLIYKKNLVIQTLPQPKIGVIKNSSNISVLQFHFPQAVIVGVNSYQAGTQALLDEKIDAFATDGSATINWLKIHPDFQRSKQALNSHSFAIAMPRGLQYGELRQKMSGSLESLKTQKWLLDRAKFWGLE